MKAAVSQSYGLIDGVYRSRTGMNYTNLLYYEANFFDEKFVEEKRSWMAQNWSTSIVYGLAYCVAVFIGQLVMRSRAKFELRGALVAWNFFLAAFSLLGAIRVWPDFVHRIQSKGLEHSICSCDYMYGASGLWVWLFILSKLPELVDTLFIVLRKQPLIFLHWYHHATVLVYCWYSFHDFTASGIWFALMNYTVHSAMYSYYGFRAMRFKIPKWVNIVITSGQIFQMIIGIFVNSLAFYTKQRGGACDVTYENIFWSFVMYLSYFLLFSHFFYNAYLSKPNKQHSTSKTAAANRAHTHHSNVHHNQHNHHDEQQQQQQHLTNGKLVSNDINQNYVLKNENDLKHNKKSN